jgi:hypothetical protein
VLGDNGTVVLDALGRYSQITTTSPGIGGNDSVQAGSGDDVLLGGNGADSLAGQNGFNIVIGDNANVVYVNGLIERAETIDLYDGADDVLRGGANLSILFGGFGNDLLYGTLNQDVMVGDYASLLFEGGRALRLDRFGSGTNAPDLIARSQGGVFVANIAGVSKEGVDMAATAAKRLAGIVSNIATPQGVSNAFRSSDDGSLVFDAPRSGPVEDQEEQSIDACPAPKASAGEVDVPVPECVPADDPNGPDNKPAKTKKLPQVKPGSVPSAAAAVSELALVNEEVQTISEGNGLTHAAVVGMVGAQAWRAVSASTGVPATNSSEPKWFDSKTGRWVHGTKAKVNHSARTMLDRLALMRRPTAAAPHGTDGSLEKATTVYQEVDGAAIVESYRAARGEAPSTSIQWRKLGTKKVTSKT